ncbi:MAG: hypothetical protein PHH30_09470, partial [Bacteroidales bacterium]|nr:hypothetical protein [Bacteroidales bacterium]
QELYDFSTESTSSAESLNFTVTLDYLSRNYDGFGNRTTVYLDYNEEVSGHGYIFEHLDSAFIYDRYYKRVLKVEVLEDETVDNNKSIYFSNSDYGILRHDIYSDTVLLSSKLLMRKNIVR